MQNNNDISSCWAGRELSIELITHLFTVKTKGGGGGDPSALPTFTKLAVQVGSSACSRCLLIGDTLVSIMTHNYAYNEFQLFKPFNLVLP